MWCAQKIARTTNEIVTHKNFLFLKDYLELLISFVTGSLSFLTLSSTIALQRSADEYSSLISTNSGGFPFGDDVVYAVFVSTIILY